MHPVEQFLQNGTLPFVGREAESAQILDLWRGSVDAGRLRGMMLTAEAGAGKSRLLEEVIARVRNEGGAVVHAKLYPEAANDLAQTILGGVERDASLRKISGESEGDGIVAAIAMLRRIGRLRQTLLVIEDMHLLPEEAHPDLGLLLRGLADETLSFLVAARPVELGARGLLEPFVVTNLVMKGLRSEEMAQLWEGLFGTALKGERLALLESVTFGNPLALRSALRGLVEAGGVREQGSKGVWKVGIPTSLFESTIRQSVSLVVEGLLSGLRPQTRAGAIRVAMLGEVVADESALAILGSREILDELIEAALLVPIAHPVLPLPALEGIDPDFRISYPASRRTLLVFTHSLVQNRLREEVSTIPKELVELIADALPLYSLLPFTLVQLYPLPEEAGAEHLSKMTRRIGIAVQLLDRTATWREVGKIWDGIQQMIERLAVRIGSEETRWLRLWWLTNTLSILGRREIGSERWIATLAKSEEESRVVDSRRIAYTRLLVICHILEYEGRSADSRSTLKRTDQMVEELLASWPEYGISRAYIYYLDTVGSLAERLSDETILRDVYAKTLKILEDKELDPGMRSLVHYRLLKYALTIFDTPEELADRFNVLDQIEEETDEEDGYYGLKKVTFLLEAGAMSEAAELSDRVLQSCRELGIWRNYFLCFGTGMIARNGLHYDREQTLESAAKAFRTGVPDDIKSDIEHKIYGAICLTGFLTDDQRLLPDFLERIGRGEDDLLPAERALVTIASADRDQVVDLGSEGASEFLDINIDRWELWRASLLDRKEADLADFLGLFERPIVRFFGIVRGLFAIRVGMMLGLDQGAEGSRFREGARTCCERSLAWMIEKHSGSYTPALLGVLRDLGEDELVAAWSARIEAMPTGEDAPISQEVPSKEEEVEEKIRISMLGTIGIALPPDDYAPLRGSRLRMILGLLVAASLLERPLSATEFTRLAGGMESDPERARKKKNMGIVRLREVLGRDAIITDGESPRLNDEIVEVDLIETLRMIEEGENALRSGSVLRAIPLIKEGLARLTGEVPFPTLYDDFFEAVRSDIDRRLRSVLLETGGLLLEGGGVTEAIDLLGSGLAALPGDDEVGELLADALQRNGEEVEAERVRLKIRTD